MESKPTLLSVSYEINERILAMLSQRSQINRASARSPQAAI